MPWKDELADRSRRPHSSPGSTRAAVVALILAQRRLHPTWGPRKLLVCLQYYWPNVHWPAPSTIGDILKRHGMVVARQRRSRLQARARPFLEAREPNDIWCVDFKGDFCTENSVRCYPLTVMDAASRFLLACVGQLAPEGDSVRKTFLGLLSIRWASVASS